MTRSPFLSLNLPLITVVAALLLPSMSSAKPPALPSVEVVTDAESEPATIQVQRVNVRGNTVLDDAQLQRIAEPFLGRPIDVAEVEMLRQALSRFYVESGYVNSGVVLDDPPMRDDALRFIAIEGRLVEVKVSGNGRLDEGYLTERLVGEEPLDMGRLGERFQLMLDDPQIEKMNARLIPGDRPGEAILDLDVQPASPYELSLFAHNARAPSIGAEAIGARGVLRNLTGRGDLLQGSLESADDSKMVSGYTVEWNMPLTYHGTSIRVRYENSDAVLVEPPLDELDIQSAVAVVELGASQLFIDTLRHRLSAGVDYVEKDNRTRLLGQRFSFIANEVAGHVETESWRAWLEYSFRTTERVIALRSTYAWTDTNLLELDFELPSVSYPDTRYEFWLGQIQYIEKLSESGMQLVVRGTAQYSDDNLLSLDGLAIGGSASVRGFRENQLIRDRGYVISTEVLYPLRDSTLPGDTDVIAFVDIGKGENKQGRSDDLSSIGIAARYNHAGFHVSLTLAARINEPSNISDQSGDLQDKGVHFAVSYDLL